MKYFDDDERALILSENIQGVLPVFSCYLLKNGVITPPYKVTLRHLYFPFLHKELPSHFAHLYVGTDSDIMGFINSYGMLGRAFLIADKTRRVEERQKYPESVDWIRAHSKTIDICLTIKNHLQKFECYDIASYKNPPLEDYIKQFLIRPNCYKFEDIGETYNITTMQFIGENSLYQDAIKILQELINCNIRYFYRTIELLENGHLSNNYNFTALIEVIYWIVADTLISGTVKQCEECGRVFIQTDKRQKYCPIMKDVKTQYPNIKDSPCAVRHRVRVWRDAHKKG